MEFIKHWRFYNMNIEDSIYRLYIFRFAFWISLIGSFISFFTIIFSPCIIYVFAFIYFIFYALFYDGVIEEIKQPRNEK